MALTKKQKERRKLNKNRRNNYVSKPIEILPNPHKIGDKLYCHTTFPNNWRLWTAGRYYTVDNVIQDKVWVFDDEGESVCDFDLKELNEIFDTKNRERKLERILNEN